MNSEEWWEATFVKGNENMGIDEYIDQHVDAYFKYEDDLNAYHIPESEGKVDQVVKPSFDDIWDTRGLLDRS